MTDSNLLNITNQPETLADELFGEDTQHYGFNGTTTIYHEGTLNHLVGRIERRTATHRLFTSHPIYDVDDDEISIIGPSGARIMADRDWVNSNFVTLESNQILASRLNILEAWQDNATTQRVNIHTLINDLINRVDTLERMINGEK